MALGICTQQKVIYHSGAPHQGFLSSALLNPCPVASRDAAALPQNPAFTKSVVTAEGTAVSWHQYSLTERQSLKISDLHHRLLSLPGCRIDRANEEIPA